MLSLTDIPFESQCKQIMHEILSRCGASCGHKVAWDKNKNYGWCRICQKKVRPKATTIFFSSKLSYRQLFCLIWCWQYRQSPGSITAALGLSYPTVRRWYKRFRESLPPSPPFKLEGVVEVDEAYFGKRRHGGQTIVVGAIERITNPITNTRRLKLRIIPDTEQDSLEMFLEDNVLRGSLVVTDLHGGYNGIEWLGFLHETWNHSEGLFSGTNHIEQNWSAMKRHMRKLYGNIPTRDMQLIIDEWEARHNRPELFLTPEGYLRAVVPY